MIELPGSVHEIVLVAFTEDPDNAPCPESQFITCAGAKVFTFPDLTQFCKVEGTKMKFHNMPPGFVCVLKTSRASQQVSAAAQNLGALVVPKDLLDNAEIQDLNHLLFKCDHEERDFSKGTRGTYGLDGRQLEYAGLMSVVHIL